MGLVRFTNEMAIPKHRRLGPIAVMALALVAVVLLLSIVAALFSLISDTRPLRSDAQPASVASSFSLAPPEFLLRLSLFPEQQRKRLLLGVIIENQETARLYHAGLEKAIFVQEFNVEGMISRFLVLFDVKDLPAMIGPIRSLRPYFVDASQPWTPVIIHAGGSPEAFERVALLPDLTAINGLKYDDGEHFIRSDAAPAPHNLFLPKESVDSLLDENLTAEEEGVMKAYPHTLWPPYMTGAPPSGGSGAATVHVDFHSPAHDVGYRLLPDGSYLRTNGGTESALRPKNVLIVAMPVTGIGEFGRLTIPTAGEGDLLLLRSGSIYRGRWQKEGAEDPWVFLDEDGEPLRFASGVTWMTQVPELGRVEWE